MPARSHLLTDLCKALGVAALVVSTLATGALAGTAVDGHILEETRQNFCRDGQTWVHVEQLIERFDGSRYRVTFDAPVTGQTCGKRTNVSVTYQSVLTDLFQTLSFNHLHRTPGDFAPATTDRNSSSGITYQLPPEESRRDESILAIAYRAALIRTREARRMWQMRDKELQEARQKHREAVAALAVAGHSLESGQQELDRLQRRRDRLETRTDLLYGRFYSDDPPSRGALEQKLKDLRQAGRQDSAGYRRAQQDLETVAAIDRADAEDRALRDAQRRLKPLVGAVELRAEQVATAEEWLEKARSEYREAVRGIAQLGELVRLEAEKGRLDDFTKPLRFASTRGPVLPALPENRRWWAEANVRALESDLAAHAFDGRFGEVAGGVDILLSPRRALRFGAAIRTGEADLGGPDTLTADGLQVLAQGFWGLGDRSWLDTGLTFGRDRVTTRVGGVRDRFLVDRIGLDLGLNVSHAPAPGWQLDGRLGWAHVWTRRHGSTDSAGTQMAEDHSQFGRITGTARLTRTADWGEMFADATLRYVTRDDSAADLTSDPFDGRIAAGVTVDLDDAVAFSVRAFSVVGRSGYRDVGGTLSFEAKF
jgi:tetratricopeptide (TPR) repeat protein